MFQQSSQKLQAFKIPKGEALGMIPKGLHHTVLSADQLGMLQSFQVLVGRASVQGKQSIFKTAVRFKCV